MALLHDILTWTKDLPLWQRDACRRLLQSDKELTEKDYKDLYNLLKQENSIDISDDICANPLSDEHIPSRIDADQPIILKSIKNLKNVNLIPNDQSLKFIEKGITVIYGGNSSGKSGYARVLKRACRSRDQDEPILPDARKPELRGAIPTAAFEIAIDKKTTSVKWSQSETPPDSLSTISVFDSLCARSYLTNEQDVAFLPYGLDVVENLANQVIPELGVRLEAEIDSIDTDLNPFVHLLGDTKVGLLMDSLSEKTNSETIKSLGTLSKTDSLRLKELNKALAERNPLVKANEFKISSKRLKTFGDRILTNSQMVNDVAVEAYKKIEKEKNEAEVAEKTAAENLQSDEVLLPGTGESTWKLFFEAARKYSTEIAYQDQPFPFTAEGSVCLFCQRELEEKEIIRLDRFYKYVNEDISRLAGAKRHNLTKTVSELKSAQLKIGFEESLREEILALDDKLPARIDNVETSLLERRNSILESFESGEWIPLPDIDLTTRTSLRNLAATHLRQYRTLLRVSDPEKNILLSAERNELIARQELSKVLDLVLSVQLRIKREQELSKCKRQLKTRRISDKSRELSNKVVTIELKKALDAELKSMGVGHIDTVLKPKNVRGRMFHQLLLDLPTNPKIDKILSEGEQRAIALASFLAELSIADHSGGIVLDDPVSSLDHNRRKNVARRFVQEAKKRQVIIFTHDTSYLGILSDEIRDQAVPHAMMFLEWCGNLPGQVNPGLPWDHKGYKERIDYLERTQLRLSKSWPVYPAEQDKKEILNAYNRLRATLERVVQDVVFNGVVKRYRDWIRIDKLQQVVGFNDDEYAMITKIHKHCSDVVDAHDTAADKDASIPTPTEFLDDLTLLKKLVESIKLRRKK